MATLRDLPRILDEDPAVRQDLASMLVAFCARRGIDVKAEELAGQNITDEAVSGYILSLPPGETPPGVDQLPQLLTDDAAVRDDLIATLVAFCGRHGIEAPPEELVGLVPQEEEVSGYSLTGGLHLGALPMLRPLQPLQSSASITCIMVSDLSR
jgi:hypothetical protein